MGEFANEQLSCYRMGEFANEHLSCYSNVRIANEHLSCYRMGELLMNSCLVVEWENC